MNSIRWRAIEGDGEDLSMKEGLLPGELEQK